MSTIANTELVVLQEEQVRLWDDLELERVSRIAGDDANNALSLQLQDNLFGTEGRLSTEVLHREQGDLNNLGTLNALTQALSEYRIKTDQEINAEQIARQQLGVDLNASISSATASFNHREYQLYQTINSFKADYYDDHNQLDDRISKYEDMLQDITTDSIQITMDNGEINMGAWTILSQAREWDLEILGKVKGFQDKTVGDIDTALEELQKLMPVEQDLINKVIESLSETPAIKNLSDELSSAITNQHALELAQAQEAAKRAEEMIKLAAQQAEALALEKQDLINRLAQEAEERVDAITREADIRSMQLTQVEDDKAIIEADMDAIRLRVANAENGLTSEIQQRKDGDTSNLNALNTYKVSNDSAVSGLATSISNNVTKTSANTTAIAGLTSRLTTAETETGSVRTLATDAMNKATTAITANSALSTRVDALAASITESDGTVVDVNAFNALKAEVNTNKGSITSLVEDVTALENNYSTVNNTQLTQGTAISNLTTKMTAAENTIQQSADDIVLLKSDITTINGTLTNKVDAQAFNNLSTAVDTLENGFSTQASNITDLRGSLDTTNVNVSNAASAAQNAMNAAGSKGKVIFSTTQPATEDRLIQNLWIDTVGNANTPKRWNGSAWVVVTDKVATDALAAANAANSLANTKADATAFNSLDQKVTVMDGKVNTNTNSITSLNGKITTVEGDLATKLDSSAMVNYYTKQQTDDKALSTAAGEISKYDASLVIGGVNQLLNSEAERSSTASSRREYLMYESSAHLKQFYDDNLGKDITISFEVMVPVAGAIQAYSSNNSAHIFTGITPWIAANTWTKVAVTVKPAKHSTTPNHAVSTLEFYGTYDTGRIPTVRKVQLEAGNKATDWAPSPRDTQASLDANATAIQNTNVEVSRVDGKTTTNANAITGLTSRMGIVEGQVSTKAEASALQNYYTKTEAAANATTVAAGEVAKYDSSLKVGGENLWSLDSATLAKEQGNATVEYIDRNKEHYKTTVTAFSASNANITRHDNMLLSKSLEDVDKNSQYTLSFEIRAIKAGALSLYAYFNGANTITTIIASTEWQRFEFTPSAKPTGTGATNTSQLFAFGLISTGWAINDWYEVRHIQMQKGTKATAFSKASLALQKALDANATAISNTNTEVIRVDGKVTTASNQINALTGRVSTVENGLATKADVSAVNALTTRVGNVEGGLSTQASNTTNLEAKIDSRSIEFSLAHDYDTKNPAEWESHYGRDLSTHFKTVTDGKIGNSVFRKDTSHDSTNYNFNLAVVPNDRAYRLSMWVRCSSNATGIVGFNYKYTTDASPEFTTAYSSVGSRAITKDGTWQLITAIADFRTSAFNRLRFGFYTGHTGSAGWWEMQGFKVEAVVNADDVDGTLATAAALTTTNTEVSRIDGVVSGHSTQLSNLTASVAGKADTSALNALTVRVAAEEGKSSSQATSITNLTSSLSATDTIAKNALPQVTGGANGKSFKDVLNYYNSVTNTNNIVIETPITFGSYMFKIMINGYNYVLNKSVIECSVSGYAYPGPTYHNHSATDLGTFSVRMRLGIKNGKVCVILSPKGTNWSYPQFSVSAHIGHTTPPDSWKDGWSAIMKTEAELDTYGITSIIEPSILDVSGEIQAAASAVSTLDTKVIAIDGKVTTQASQLTVLTSDSNANKNALSVQGKVIDGVKANYMVKMETNGVIGGFGIIQEATGAMGTVTTTFGVNANNFFIGAPSGGKKPFIVTTANQVVNGVTYPAGTYIDVALIANATIGNAKISDLDATKITAGTIDAARIGANSITADKLLVNGGNILYAGLDCFHHFTSTPPNSIGGGSLLLENVAGLFGPKRLRHISTTTASYVYIHPTANSAAGWLKLTPGQRYVLSAYVSTTSTAATALQLAAVVREGLTQTGGVGGATGVLSVKAADGWVRISVAFTPGGTNPYLAYYLRHSATGITSYWDGFMLEEVPAGVSSPSTFSPGGQTRIDGGTIVANSISADKISADAIETISLNARNGTFTAADGSKTVVNGGLTQVFYPNGKVAVKLGVW